ncbi:MAG: multiheme c-type cytochrome [Ferrovibrio sp.]
MLLCSSFTVWWLRGARTWLATVVAIAFSVLLAPAPASATDPTNASAAGHLGATTCGSSVCHGAAQPWRNSPIQQNEFLVWIKQDPHARAYKTLLTDQAKQIARNLGLPNAHEAPACLNCHADNVPLAQRGRAFSLADGVSCETCHGGAQQWLGLHVSGASSHAQNVAAGMYPMDDPVARGERCLGCHMGNSERWLDHRIMGAGHPRLRFELDTFTSAQPAHFRIDADYRKRKHVSSPAKTWMVGQALAAATFLDGLSDPRRNKPGLFPELVFYNCHSCHHPMTERRFEAAADGSMPPGMPRLQDISLVLLQIAAEVMDTELAGQLSQNLGRLHEATARQPSNQGTAARALRADVTKALPRLQQEPSKAQVQQLLDRLFTLASKPGYRSFETAEQVTMALGSMLAHLRQQNLITDAQYQKAATALERVYKSVESDTRYSIAAFDSAVQELKKSLPTL